MGTLELLALFAVVVVVVLNMLARVQPGHIAVPLRLGKRSKRYVTEGWVILFPFIETINKEYTYSVRERGPVTIDCEAYDAARSEIRIRMQCDWRLDPTITTENGHIRLTQQNLATTEKKLSGEIEGIVNSLVGSATGWRLIGTSAEFKKSVETLVQESKIGPSLGVEVTRVTVVRIVPSRATRNVYEQVLEGAVGRDITMNDVRAVLEHIDEFTKKGVEANTALREIARLYGPEKEELHSRVEKVLRIE